MSELKKVHSGSDLDPVVSEIKQISYTEDSSASQQDDNSKKQRFNGFFKQFERRAEGEVMKKSLTFRHICMVALTTGVGTGLLVGSGKSLHSAGIGNVLIGYFVMGTMLFSVLQSAGEMAVAYGDLSGGFNAYARKFVDESVAFSVGWNYCIQWLTVISLELVTGSITIKYWTDLNSDIFVAVFYVVLLFIHFFGAKGYGEAEFFCNMTKLIMLTGFVILGIIIDTGGAGAGKHYIGAHLWYHPGAFNNGFKGTCTVFVTAAFAYGATEFVALTAADTKNPRAVIPSACKLVFWRIAFFFMTTLVIVGCLVPYNSPDLMGASGSGSRTSPYVLAISTHGIKAVPSIVNAVILISVFSVANSALYSSSRVLQSLAEQGFAPKYFDYIDNTGRPFRSLCACSIIGLFAFVAASDKQDVIFDWLLSISGLSTIFTWTTICISHIRFRAALKAQGKDISELGYVSSTGVIGSYYSIVLNIFVIVCQFWVSLWPVDNGGKISVNNFFQNYLGVFVLILFYVGHKIYSRSWSFWIPADQIDLDTHRKTFDPEIIALEEAEAKIQFRNSPWYRKIAKILFF